MSDADLIRRGDAPERIWIEDDECCPYYYDESELAEAGGPLIEYIRADLATPAPVVPAEGLDALIAEIKFETVNGEIDRALAGRIITALRSAPPVGARVKPLMWEEVDFCGQPAAFAETEFGAWMVVAYRGRSGRWAHTDPAGNDSGDDWETRFEAQAAAQADYEARILAALLPAGEGEE